ncbi:MAG: uncharacterized protein QOK15_750 [Nocardioidaceae bacterium]|jgi:hypothetical protein|nr:uncharacterized protein [Nocardioidaceae bacterium]
MQTMTGLMATDRPERYAKQLTSHWAARGPVTEEGGATVQRWTSGQVLRLTPTHEGLEVEVSVPAGEDLARFAEVVKVHLERFGRRGELHVTWGGIG